MTLKISLGIVFSLLAFTVNGQTKCETTIYNKLNPNSFLSKWTFFQLADTINGSILIHNQQNIYCGRKVTASITILKTDNDTIRIIDPCNNNSYRNGQIVKIIPIHEPVFSVQLPFQFDSTEYFNARTDEFDKSVRQTTWGHLCN